MKKINYLKIAAVTIMLSACGNSEIKNNSEEGKLQGSISIDGSSTVYPLSEAVAEEFKKESRDVKVTVGLSGTGGGFKKFGRGEIDMNDASRPIKSVEDSLCKANNIAYVEVRVAYDGLAVVVSPQNTWCKDITVAELKMIWEPAAQGKITRWNQVRKEWPNEEIHLFGAGVESGTYDYFTEVIVGKSHSSRGDYTASEDDNVLVQGIKSDKNALGFFGLAYFTENQDKVKLVGVDNGKGPILPSEATVRDKSYSPLGRPLFLYVNSKAMEKKEAQAFVKFYLENTKTLATDVGYISMTDEEIKQEQAKVEEFINQLAPKK